MSNAPRIKAETAFTLHVVGLSNDEISKRVGVSAKTISVWKNKFDWEQRAADILQRLREEGDENVLLVKKRQLRLTQLMQGLGIKKMQDGDLKITGSDVISAMKQEMVLLGEPSDRIDSLDKNNLTAVDINKIYDELKRKRAAAKDQGDRETSDIGQGC
jgi:hypothetical protein